MEPADEQPAKDDDYLSILTVGDGDFSASLAILRAYGNKYIRSMIITSLVPTREEWMDLYAPYAQDIWTELLTTFAATTAATATASASSSSATYSSRRRRSRSISRKPSVTILFGVDATKLHSDPRILQACQKVEAGEEEEEEEERPSSGVLDYILFHHPHLGYEVDSDNDNDNDNDNDDDDDNDDNDDDDDDSTRQQVGKTTNKHAMHAAKHASLLADYLFSARELSSRLLTLASSSSSSSSNKNGGGVDTIIPQKEVLLQRNNHKAPKKNDEPLIHLCLCAGQSKSWKLYPTLRRLGLELVGGRPSFASKPLWPHLKEEEPKEEWWTDQQQQEQQQQQQQQRLDEENNSSDNNINNRSTITGNRDGNGGRGSISNYYWLSRYGYHHRATYPSTTQLSTVVNSHHYFFRRIESCEYY